MKNRYSLIVAFFSFLALQAQDLAKKIPTTANVVVTVKGKNVLDLMSLSEFSNSKIGAEITKEMSRGTKGELKELEDLGLALDQNFYYFLETKENIFYNAFLIPFKDTSSILRLMSKEQKDIVTQNGISYLQNDYGGEVLIWNQNTVIFVIASDQNKDFYDDYGIYDYDPSNPSDSVEIVTIEEAGEAAAAEEEVIEQATEIAIEEAIEASEEEVVETVDGYDYYQSDAYKKEQEEREKRRLEREAKRIERKKVENKNTLEYARTLMAGKPQKNILQNSAYKKSLGNGKDEAMFWMNNVMDIYDNALPKNFLGPTNPYEFLNLNTLYDGMTVSGRLNFEEDEAVLDVKYSMNEDLAKAYKPMYNGKFNKNFLNYINEDNLLGYVSVNLSTQGLLEAYPELISTMFQGADGKVRDKKALTVSAAVSSATRLFSVLIDEEGAAKILRGDMLLLLTDIREKEVTYTDYEYDEDYNYKKVEKTKTETLPDFLFMFTSEEESMFHNFMKIGVLENEVNYANGIYAVEPSRSNPFDLYVMYHDNTIFIGSSQEHLSQIKSGTYPSKLSSQLKKDISKSASSFYVNGKTIISKIPSEAFPRELRKNIDFLTNNTEDLRVNFSKIKGNTLTGEMVLKTPKEGHRNSLVYFIDLMEKLMD